MAAAGAPTDEDWKKVSKLVDQFYNRPDSEPFRVPVDWKGLGLHDYPKIISNPMDLGTIKKKLQGGKYTSLHQVGADVQLVWENCKTYNREGSDFHKLATMLRKKFEDKFSKLVAETKPTATGENNNKAAAAEPAKVSLAERRQFAKSLFNLGKEELGKLLVEVEGKCPSALMRNAAEDEVELNVDKLTPDLLMELQQFVASQKKNKKTGSNKRAKTSKQQDVSAKSS